MKNPITYAEPEKYHNGYTQEYFYNGKHMGFNWALTLQELTALRENINNIDLEKKRA